MSKPVCASATTWFRVSCRYVSSIATRQRYRRPALPELPRSGSLHRSYASVAAATSTDAASWQDTSDPRPRVVILGSGWAGYVLSRALSPKQYRVLLISPRPYFVFTPLLNDSAVGTLEFRNVLESIRKPKSHIQYLQGWADDVDFFNRTVSVEPCVLDQGVGRALTSGPSGVGVGGQGDEAGEQGKPMFTMGGEGMLGGTGEEGVPTFPVSYDKLVIAVGCYSQTFDTLGVKENALFLKDVNDARRIRRRILDLFELAKMPFLPLQTKKWLLHFAIVGGGPTGMEFAACLSDLVEQDLRKMYPEEVNLMRVTLYDVADKVLPMFEKSLADYAVKQYARRNVEIKTSHKVKRLRKGVPDDEAAKNDQEGVPKHRVYTLESEQEGDVGCGMVVWSTGNMKNPFVSKALGHVRRFPIESGGIVEGAMDDPNARQWVLQKDQKSGLLLVDDHFRVGLETEKMDDEDGRPRKAVMRDVFAIGDTTVMQSGRLPGTAQVANQQALWLGKYLNKHTEPTSEQDKGFGFRDLGVMTYLGGAKAILQSPSKGEGPAKGIKGWVAFLLWRGAYLTMTLSWRNKFLVPVQWLAVKIFGRDVSRF